MRLCEYQNCNQLIEGRKGKKFCNKNCRNHNATYKKREIDRVKKKSEHYLKLIDDYKTDFNTSQEIKELYELIYKR